jgi:hypothetical protein
VGAAVIVLLLSSHEPALDENALAEAVAIYVRDLGYEVRAQPGAPTSTSPQALGRAAQIVREADARLAFWCVARGGEIVLYTVDDRAEPRALPVAGLSGRALDRVLALKVRAVLTGQADRERNEPLPSPVLPPPTSTAAPPSAQATSTSAPPRTSAPSGTSAPPGATTPATSALATRPAPYHARVWLAAGYRLIVPSDTSLLRHNAYLDVAVPWRWLEPHLTVEVGTDPRRDVSAGSATLVDVPIRLALRARLERGRFAGWVAPQLSLHVVHADGKGSDQRSGDATEASVGLGVELGASVRLTDHVAIQLGGLFEWLLPERHFTLHGATVLSVGDAHFGVSAGLAFAAP